MSLECPSKEKGKGVLVSIGGMHPSEECIHWRNASIGGMNEKRITPLKRGDFSICNIFGVKNKTSFGIVAKTDPCRTSDREPSHIPSHIPSHMPSCMPSGIPRNAPRREVVHSENASRREVVRFCRESHTYDIRPGGVEETDRRAWASPVPPSAV